MKCFIVDAYNLIHKIPGLEAQLDKSLKHARDYLIQTMVAFVANRGDVEKVWLVFDGKKQFQDLPSDSAIGVDVVYSAGETADERIVELLEEVKHKHPVTVVSEDNFVRNHAREYGRKVMTGRDFYDQVTRVKAGNGSGAENTKSIPKSLADSITDEYRQILESGSSEEKV